MVGAIDGNAELETLEREAKGFVQVIITYQGHVLVAIHDKRMHLAIELLAEILRPLPDIIRLACILVVVFLDCGVIEAATEKTK